MEFSAERKIPLYVLYKHKSQLERLYAFGNENVERCNFTTRAGWKGKVYIDEHSVDEYKPGGAFRGVDVLDMWYIKLTDYVILTEEQYKEYCIISGK